MKSITYTYDNNGNLTAVGSGIGSTNYIWDWRDRLTQTATGTATTSYGYDHDNMRVRRTILGSATTTYPNQWFNYSTSGSTTANILLPNGTPIATVEANGTATTTYWLHPDHLGGTHTVTNASGTPVQSVSYLPYGDQRLASSSSAFDEKKKFTGHEFDSDSDLTYAKARYYEQDIGRWISVEPILRSGSPGSLLKDPQQLNSYTYSRNNPIVLKDSTGNATYYFSNGAGLTGRDWQNKGTYYEFNDNAMLQANAARMENAQPGSSLSGFMEFVNLVNYGGDWDFLRLPNARGSYFFGGELVGTEIFGNIHYGYVGTAGGLGAGTLRGGAGGAHALKALFSKSTVGPLGSNLDSPQDQAN